MLAAERGKCRASGREGGGPGGQGWVCSQLESPTSGSFTVQKQGLGLLV